MSLESSKHLTKNVSAICTESTAPCMIKEDSTTFLYFVYDKSSFHIGVLKQWVLATKLIDNNPAGIQAYNESSLFIYRIKLHCPRTVYTATSLVKMVQFQEIL